MTHPVRIALAGAGIFARNAHLPALLAQTDAFEIVAVWSRTEANASALAQSIGEQTGAVPTVETELDALLVRTDVEAVDIVLPIDVQPEVVRRALAAGKHVLSEKPIAPTVEEGRALLEEYRTRFAPQGLHWMVGENLRYDNAYLAAREIVAAGTIGMPVTVSWTRHSPSTPASPYYHTAWRRAGTIAGGFVLDAGVHHAAMLRGVVGEVHAVQAFTRLVNQTIPPVDTLAASLYFENGAVGAYVASYAPTPLVATPLLVVGEKGVLRVEIGAVEIAWDGRSERREYVPHAGVHNELAAFHKTIREGVAHANTPEEALRDVAVIEAMLASGASGDRTNVREIA